MLTHFYLYIKISTHLDLENPKLEQIPEKNPKICTTFAI